MKKTAAFIVNATVNVLDCETGHEDEGEEEERNGVPERGVNRHVGGGGDGGATWQGDADESRQRGDFRLLR